MRSTEITDIDLIDNKKNISTTIKNNNKIYAIIYDSNESDLIKIDNSFFVNFE